MLKGHCECRRVRLEAEATINDFSHCHCSQCRRLHGAAFGTFAGIPLESIRILSGAADIRHYASSKGSDRQFCGHCGSALMVILDSEPQVAYVSMSILEGDPPKPPAYHIFVGSKAPWYEINDDAPQHVAWPPDG